MSKIAEKLGSLEVNKDKSKFRYPAKMSRSCYYTCLLNLEESLRPTVVRVEWTYMLRKIAFESGLPVFFRNK